MRSVNYRAVHISTYLEISIDWVWREYISSIMHPVTEPNPQAWTIDALGALAHDTRLSVFRMLVQAGPDGLTAGAIADKAAVPNSTMSHHLATLERAGLVQSQRESRLIHYRDNPGIFA